MKTINFRRDEEGMKNLAIFLAQIIREGLTYKINNAELFVEIELTGGY
jgi:phosphopantetheine adenylyltransferase